MLKSDKIYELLSSTSEDPLIIRPLPNLEEIKNSGAASLDLRLGSWFAVLRQTKTSVLDINIDNEVALLKNHYIRIGSNFILHPKSFVLGVTLEWLRLPNNIGGYVTSRSSWGRRGLIIATAVGVHPGFTGCLTLELYNSGELPIALYPGMAICQFFMHEMNTTNLAIDDSKYIGRRKPFLGSIVLDDFTKKMINASL